MGEEPQHGVMEISGLRCAAVVARLTRNGVITELKTPAGIRWPAFEICSTC